ncbi:MAG TPA: hypothetical protein PKJ08_12820 [Candidatus Cloacimonadota bacterium]|nr:hypothetical protein [Candidatus Cloacimonadota bacterium]
MTEILKEIEIMSTSNVDYSMINEKYKALKIEWEYVKKEMDDMVCI